jgi:hypothetical protein
VVGNDAGDWSTIATANKCTKVKVEWATRVTRHASRG